MKNLLKNLILLLVTNLTLLSLSFGQDSIPKKILINREIAIKCLQTKEESEIRGARLVEKDVEIKLLDGKIVEKDIQIKSYETEINSWERTEMALKEENRLLKEEKAILKKDNKKLRNTNKGLKIGGVGILLLFLLL